MSFFTATVVLCLSVFAGGTASFSSWSSTNYFIPRPGEFQSYVVPDTASKTTPSRVATSPTYGYSEKEPILIGGAFDNGVKRSHKYLKALRGPKGEMISYERRGSCCPFETKNSELGGGLLDAYELTYKGLSQPLVLYINIYDPGELMIPQGLTVSP